MAPTILITGANRGIGFELVKAYTARGWWVRACCREPEEAHELKNVAHEMDGAVTVHRLDVTNTLQIAELAEELKGQPLDILFNNAGISGPMYQEWGALDETGWLTAFKVNAIAPFKMAVAFLEQVARSKRKIIATMGSVMGSITENSSGGYYVYRSTKAAGHMVMKSLAVDLAERGIITVVLHPGWVRTVMGGPNAPVTPEECAADLYKVLNSLGPADNGRFLDHLGKELPW